MGILLRTVSKSLVKSLGLSAAVMGPGVALMSVNQALGVIWLLAGSFALMAWTYRKPWRMLWVSLLVPPVVALASYLLQLAFFGDVPEPELVLMAGLLGIGLGIYRGRSHQLFVHNGQVFAQRTTAYLVLWMACYLVTQLTGLMQEDEATALGRIGGAFSTAMLTAVSVVLVVKFARVRRNLKPVSAVRTTAAVLMMLFGASSAFAQPTVDIDVAGMRTIVREDFNDSSLDANARSFGMVRGSQRLLRAEDGGRVTLIWIEFRSEVEAQRYYERQYQAHIDVVRGDDRRLIRDLPVATAGYMEEATTGGPGAFLGFGRAYRGRWVMQVDVVVIGGGQMAEARRLTTELFVAMDRAALNSRAVVPPNVSVAPPTESAPPAGAPPALSYDEDASELAALIAILLIAGGISVSVANALATAVAQVMIDSAQQTTTGPESGSGEPAWDQGTGLEASGADAEPAEEGAEKARALAQRLEAERRWQDEAWDDLRNNARDQVRREATSGFQPVAPLDHPALDDEAQRQFDERQRAWVREQASDGDYASSPAGFVSAIDAFNRQKKRLDALDRLLDGSEDPPVTGALDQINRIREELARARTGRNTERVPYLEEQDRVARENFRRIQGARVDAANRMAEAGNRIMVQGASATTDLLVRGAGDVEAGAEFIRHSSRIGANILDQRSRGNLPWQQRGGSSAIVDGPDAGFVGGRRATAPDSGPRPPTTPRDGRAASPPRPPASPGPAAGSAADDAAGGVAPGRRSRRAGLGATNPTQDFDRPAPHDAGRQTVANPPEGGWERPGRTPSDNPARPTAPAAPVPTVSAPPRPPALPGPASGRAVDDAAGGVASGRRSRRAGLGATSPTQDLDRPAAPVPTVSAPPRPPASPGPVAGRAVDDAAGGVTSGRRGRRVPLGANDTTQSIELPPRREVAFRSVGRGAPEPDVPVESDGGIRRAWSDIFVRLGWWKRG